MLEDVQLTFQEVGQQLKDEQTKLQVEISYSKQSLSDVFEFADEVRGFDTKDILDPLENLEIYKEFLGEEEFQNMRQSYIKTIETMDLVY